MPNPVPVELDQPTAVGGLLAASRPLPVGWERGISFRDPSCLPATVMGECPSGSNLKPPYRPDTATFRPVTAIQAVECSTFGSTDGWIPRMAGAELDRTRDDALARELLTGAASRRDAGPDSDPNPALVNTAVDLGDEAASLTIALGCLEKAILEANGGRGAVLFLPVEVVYAAADIGLLWRDGARWRTVMGSLVLASAAYDGRAPVADGTGAAPDAGDTLYVYGTTSVWASTGRRDTLTDVNRAVNDATSRAEEIALVAFSPCATFAVGTPVTACVPEGSV